MSYPILFSDEHSRVKLPELSGDPLSSYINANYVHGWSNEQHAFVATQGPLSNTIVDFYRMIWQEKVPVIVMITRLFEKNKVNSTGSNSGLCEHWALQAKCERYIPDSRSSQYGPFHVQVKSVSYRTDYEIRRLIIEVRVAPSLTRLKRCLFSSLKMNNVKSNTTGTQVGQRSNPLGLSIEMIFMPISVAGSIVSGYCPTANWTCAKCGKKSPRIVSAQPIFRACGRSLQVRDERNNNETFLLGLCRLSRLKRAQEQRTGTTRMTPFLLFIPVIHE